MKGRKQRGKEFCLRGMNGKMICQLDAREQFDSLFFVQKLVLETWETC